MNLEKSRVFVLTDIEADPDDTQSLVRLLLYSNVFDIEGLVATTSIHQKDRVAPESIHRVIDAYAKVSANLRLHEPGFPDADVLRKVTTSGQTSYGMAAVGLGKDSPGSRLLVKALEKEDKRPLWVCVWGGPNTLAQALHSIADHYSPSEVKSLIAKLRVYTISDQDDSAHWIRRQFPELFYIVSPGGYGAATWTGINSVIDGIDNRTISNAWLRENIQQGHGPLGQCYPDVAYGMEGDTPSFLGLIPNGLNEPERPDWGGWGGRYELRTPSLDTTDSKGFTGGVPVPQESRPIWTNAVDTFTPRISREYGQSTGPGDHKYSDHRATLWRWRDDFQNDFAARMDWTFNAVSDSNHPPVVKLAHPNRLTAKSGEGVILDASPSYDPDGDSLSFWWFQYREAGTYPGEIELWGAENLWRRGFVAPKVGAPQTAHFIVRVTDKGTPPLARYERVVVTIQP
ncbi:MAG: DUF1593 domain-containing protein [Armatimonadetes bacterium]|nr:DUF1593 domain-containing protein [Armatimonadota bacterium]